MAMDNQTLWNLLTSGRQSSDGMLWSMGLGAGLPTQQQSDEGVGILGLNKLFGGGMNPDFNAQNFAASLNNPELQKILTSQVANKSYGTRTGSGNTSRLEQEFSALMRSNKSGSGLEHAQRAAADLSRYGVNSLSDLQAVQVPMGKYKGKDQLQTIYYNKTNGTLVPTDFGSSMKGEGGSYYTLMTTPQGQVVPKGTWTDTSDKNDLMTVAAMFAAPLGAAALGLGGSAGAISGGGGAGGGFGGGALSATEGATGLASLPQAGTWAQSALPTLGTGAGSWASPTALGGISGITDAGGLTLGNALSAGNAVGDAAGTFGTSSGVPSGAASSAYDTYNQGGSLLDNLFKNISNVPTSNPLANQGQQASAGGNNLVNLLASIYGAVDNSATDRTESLAQQMLKIGDPFGDQRQKYESLLAQSFDNPAGTYDQYRANDETFFNQLAAQNAARGRNTDAYKMGVEREAAFNNWLTNYRTQLGGFAGAQFDPSRMAGDYFNSMNTANLINDYNNKELVGTIGNIFGGGSQQSGGGLGSLISGGKDLYNAGKSVWDWGSSALGNLFS